LKIRDGVEVRDGGFTRASTGEPTHVKNSLVMSSRDPVREELAHDLLAGELARFVSKSTPVLVAMEI
jgi:hypothetical protein